MEFLGGVLLLLAGAGGVAAAARLGRRAAYVSLAVAVLLEVLATAAYGLDWGYSWVEARAIHLVIDRNVWLALPGLFGALSFLGFLPWGLRFSPYAAASAGLGAMLWVPILMAVERNVDMSFLAPAPLFVIFASALAGFLYLPAAVALIPPPTSRWHRVAFGPRASLIAAIDALRLRGFAVRPAETVFESGSAHGRVRGVEVQVTSRPGGWPPGYGLHVRAMRVTEGELPAKPGFAPSERISRSGWDVEYQGFSPGGFQLDADRLDAFVVAMSGET